MLGLAGSSWTMMAHEDYKEMVVAEAFTALEHGEAGPLADHLSDCTECLGELDSWRATAAALALVAEPLEPSPAVRERLLARIRAEKGAGGGTTSAAKAPANANVVSFPKPQSRFQLRRYAAIAAAVLFVALSASLGILWQQYRAARVELEQLSLQVMQAQRDLDRERETVRLLGSPQTVVAELKGTSAAPQAHARLALDTRTGQGVLIAEGLPSVATAKTYQLWFIVGGSPLPGGVFRANASGRAMLYDQVPAAAVAHATFAITVEDAGGARTPTMPIFLSGGT
jgi:Anti-sigma-K factor rskA, C-terminal